MSNVSKQAAKDAEEYARSYMAYGEGAGTRRKLIEGTVQYKMRTIPGYQESFYNASERQDMARFATEAKRTERRRRVNTAVARNTKAVLNGKYENANTALLIVGTTAYFAHRYGYDKKLYKAGKKKVQQFKARFKKNKDDVVHTVHSM